MKTIRKKISKIVILCILIFAMIMPYSQAQTILPTPLGTMGNCGELLTYKGETIETYYVYYPTKSLFYPTYCIDETKQGVNSHFAYGVQEKDEIHDVKLWRYVINGYPYKKIQELGCETLKEAYMATQQAIYCYLYNRKVEDYGAIGEAGKRTLQALKQIVKNAQESQEIQTSNVVTIKAREEQFTIDDIDNTYASKTYDIISDSPVVQYEIKAVTKDGKQLKITDETNKETNQFSENQAFKVLIPIEEMKEEKTFEMNINATLYTRTIFEGVPEEPMYQPYVMTAAKTETVKIVEEDTYTENEGSIQIVKQDQETKERLKGVGFSILDANKEPIYANLQTDENGEICIKHLAPGNYYIQETQNKKGYVENSQLTLVTVGYNQKVIVTVNNIKEKIQEEKKVVEEKRIQTQIVVPEVEEETSTIVPAEEQIQTIVPKVKKQAQTTISEVKRLPVTGM